MRPKLPLGTVTFLFTDIEGSTRLLHELGAERYARELDRHRRVVRDACARFEGVEVDTQGDAFFVAFPTAPGALAAARAIREGLRAGPVAVRMGLHTGTPLATDEGYVGSDVHRAARIAAAGHGGQVLVSSATAALVDDDLRDLGEHRFKDLAAAERVFQVGGDDFPPLRSLRNVRLPVPATAFVGREEEVAAVVALLLRDDVRLLTLTGPGGTGKTRLGLQAAANASDAFPDGVWWVPLASLRDPALIDSAIAQVLGVKEQPGRDVRAALRSELAGKRCLLVLDNIEQLLPVAAAALAQLVSPDATLLVTSRERLQVQAEHVYAVPTLTQHDAVELFLARARAVDPAFEPTAAVDELCARLDNLPLALELAAARTPLFSVKQLVERLTKRLDLLKGARDADPRQQTLRATIEWSYDLLTTEEQRLFGALSVFPGGCTFEAAEEVCGAGADTLQSLLDKSLVRRRDSKFGPRYWMLETIREYAIERCVEADAEALSLRHAQWFVDLARRLFEAPGARFRGVDEKTLDRLQDEYASVRSALEWAWANGQWVVAVELGARCVPFWIERAGVVDASSWLAAVEHAVPRLPEPVQLKALQAAGLIAFFVRGETGRADELWIRAAALAERLDEGDELTWVESRRGGVLWERGELDRALELRERELARARSTGDRWHEAQALHFLGEVLRDLGRFDEAERALVDADVLLTQVAENQLFRAANTHSLGDLALDRRDLGTAARFYRDSLELAVAQQSVGTIAACLAGLASVLAEHGEGADAAKVWGAVCSSEVGLGRRLLAAERRRYEARLRRLEGTPAWREGSALTLEEAAVFAQAVCKVSLT